MNLRHHCDSLKRLPFDFEPRKWDNFLTANCYEYLLNFQNSSCTPLTVGSYIGKEFQCYRSNDELINTLQEELFYLGFSIELTSSNSITPFNKMKFYISRSRCGDYHFYRLDSNNKWSHKFAYSEPTNLDFSGNPIVLPEKACKTDMSVGYFFLCKRIE